MLNTGTRPHKASSPRSTGESLSEYEERLFQERLASTLASNATRAMELEQSHQTFLDGERAKVDGLVNDALKQPGANPEVVNAIASFFNDTVDKTTK